MIKSAVFFNFSLPFPTSVIQRFVEMEEVAGMALYLSSKQASAITGSAIRVEGGILSTI
ncbi:SDR family oxidoreductase [Bacillus sp. SM2101]|uniref:SDR family oxidoreductase n=1 Tax=Bacillus sp. SM2101 TaxID=2805366 RepID=UPI001BDE5180